MFFVTLASLLLIALVLVDGVEYMVLPRRVSRRLRPARLFFHYSWIPFAALARHMRTVRRRETFLSFFGPVSTLVLLALWALSLILGFALLYWSLGLQLRSLDGRADLAAYLYLSGVTFFTLGFGDITLHHSAARLLSVAEAGIGFGFLAVIIGYLPVLYQSFSRREASISRLDSRAGSPPSAGQLLLRWSQAHNCDVLDQFLEDWERWAAELLESHISFPVLSYYRSQHDNQSWLAALTAILDTCAIVIAGALDAFPYQPQLTFAMARHAAVDLALIFNTPPRPLAWDRLPRARLMLLGEMLQKAGCAIRQGPTFENKLVELRGMYEPFVNALANHFLFSLPPIYPETATVDNWQTSAWMRRVKGIGKLAALDPADEHFD